MTVEEIKSTYTMREIVERYNVKVARDGMCCCPIHGEKHPSMKIYKDSFNCFACGANGDIFTFVQNVENCDFKTAFYLLGGKYTDKHNDAKMAQYRAQKRKETAERKAQKRKRLIRLNDIDLHAYRQLFYEAEEGSDDMWEYLGKYTDAYIKMENLCGEEL